MSGMHSENIRYCWNKGTSRCEGFTRIEQYEKFYATINNKLHKHYRKWCIDSEEGTLIDQFVVQYINSIS